MKRDNERYMRAAQRVTEAEDPRGEILRIAQLASGAERTRQRLVVGGSALGVVFAGVVAWQAFGAAPTGEPGPAEQPPVAVAAKQVDPAQEAAWVTGLFTTAAEVPLTAEDDQRLRKYMQKPSAEVERLVVDWLANINAETARRDLTAAEPGRMLALLYAPSNAIKTWSLNILAVKGHEIPEERLVWFLTNPEPRAVTVALSATWVHCTRKGTFPAPEAIETFVYGEDREQQKAAILALSSLKKYVPSDRLMDFLESGDREIRQIAGELLRRKGQ